MSRAEPAAVAPTRVREAEATSPNERIEALDAVRGLALFGVLAINVVNEFRVSIFQQFLPKQTRQGALDGVVEDVLMFAFSLKALALFSILFGVGLAIQFERLDRYPMRLSLLLRRLMILLAVGLVHMALVWNGDILTEYALAGFLVLPFLFGPRWLSAAAAGAFFALYLGMPALPEIVPLPAVSWMERHVEEARNIYASGGFGEVFAFRIGEIPAILPLHLDIFPRTVALFLFGAFAWRTGFLRELRKNRRLLFAGGTAALMLGACFNIASHVAPSVDRTAPVLMAAGYGAILLGMMTSNAKRVLLWAVPLGRMAFTNYLLQSIVLGWIFYGYGLGLFGRLGVAAALAIGVVLYASQALLSIWWLRRYRFGPMEWLWRTLMYGAPQPLRIAGNIDAR
jgi:uncharacterized protein